MRSFSWIFSLVLHLLVIVGGAYLTSGSPLKIDLTRRNTYQVMLVGAPNKGKPAPKTTLKAAAPKATEQPKAQPKDKPAPSEESQKPKKKAVPDTAKAIPEVNATKTAKAKPETSAPEPKKDAPKKDVAKKEDPKKPEPKKEDAKKEEPKKTEPKKEEPKVAPKKAPTADEILAAALADAKKEAKPMAPAKGVKGGRGGSGNALDAALADARKTVASQGAGDGSGGSGDSGVATGTLEEWYAGQAVEAIRANWRFQRMNKVLTAIVELRLNAAGEILSSRLRQGSGRGDFDASVMRAVEDTKKLPPLPQGISANVVVNFSNVDQ